MCAHKDPHYAEYHSDFLKVGITIEVADSKIVSRSRVVVSTSSTYHSSPLDKPDNFDSGPESISSKMGKWRKFFFRKIDFLRKFSISCKISLCSRERALNSTPENVFSRKLRLALKSYHTTKVASHQNVIDRFQLCIKNNTSFEAS